MPAHPRLRAAFAVPVLAVAMLAGGSTSSAAPTTTSTKTPAADSGHIERALAQRALAQAATGQKPSLDSSRSPRGTRASRSGPRFAFGVKPMKVERQVVIAKPTWMTPVVGYHLTSRFGDVSWLWSSSVHTGLDFAAPSGTPIRSIAEGTVVETGYAGAYGYRTIVRLDDGSEVWYCHQSSVAVQAGQRLDAGQLLGYVGSTGNVTGSHLHLEVRLGDTPVDPAGVLAAHGVGV